MYLLLSFIHLLVAAGIGVSNARDICFQLDQRKALNDVIEHEACRELNVGEQKTVSFSAFESPTSMEHKYILEKIKPDEYKIKLNLSFKENQFFPDEPTKVGRKMQTRINKCLKEMNPKLLGPSGEKITIELLPWAEKHLAKYKDIKSTIFLDNERNKRAYSNMYPSQISCTTILHELFHLMGLVDEYKEFELIHSFEKDCRSFGPDDSIMANSVAARRISRSVQSCFCRDPKLCKPVSKEEIESLKTCPDGYGTETITKFFIKDSNMNWVEEKIEGDGFRVGMSGMSPPPISFSLRPDFDSSGRIQNSILYPAQFRAVIFPGCKAKNKTYYGCARDAYYRPWKIVGSCNQRPPACNDESEWLK